MKKIIIAIDGPASSGKSTVAKKLAQHFKILHFNTGNLYRVISLFCIKNNIDYNNEQKVLIELNHCNIEVKFENNIQKDFLNGEFVTAYLRDEEVGRVSSIVSQYADVRKKILNTQRSVAEKMSLVMEGRDITSEVLPNANYKFFITATPEERAKRRFKELSEKGILCDYQTILNEIKIRDKRDTERKIAPLKLVPDAIKLDTTQMDIDQVVENIIKIIEKNA